MIPKANQIYRHFKGNLYRIITVATHTETEEKLVIYQALYGEYKVYARPLSMFISEVDKEKYPDAVQKMRFELVEQIVEAVEKTPNAETNTVTEQIKSIETDTALEQVQNIETDTAMEQAKNIETDTATQQIQSVEADNFQEQAEESVTIDPLLEAYLDTDSYREKLNILHGLQHRITEHMLNTMAIVIDFELPEGDIQTKYDALNDCLLTKEKYECNRIF